MTVSDVLSLVDTYRPSLSDDKEKIDWIYNLERKITEHMSRYAEKREAEENLTPESTLSLGKEYKDMYVYYVISMIDLANQDVAMYNNSCAFYNSLFSEWQKKWRREHLPNTVSKEG